MKKSVSLVLAVVLALSVGLNGYLYQLLQRSPEVVYLPAPQQDAQPTEPEYVYVHVSGAVKSPGVYSLPLGSRAINALEKAGGALEEASLDSVNLARVLFDGEQLRILLRGSSDTAEGIMASGETRVNINTATQQELETLPGIGPAKATAIITYIKQNGSFNRPEDIMRVSGIGEKTYEGLKDFIRVR